MGRPKCDFHAGRYDARAALRPEFLHGDPLDIAVEGRVVHINSLDVDGVSGGSDRVRERFFGAESFMMGPHGPQGIVQPSYNSILVGLALDARPGQLPEALEAERRLSTLFFRCHERHRITVAQHDQTDGDLDGRRLFNNNWILVDDLRLEGRAVAPQRTTTTGRFLFGARRRPELHEGLIDGARPVTTVSQRTS